MSKKKSQFKETMRATVEKVRPFLLFIKEWGLRILKLCGKISYVLCGMVSFSIIVILPFLHSYVPLQIAQSLWFPACALYLVFWAIGLRIEKFSFEDPREDFIANWGLFSAIPITLSVFVFSYYEIHYIWCWVIFTMIFIATPVFLFNLYSLDLKVNDRSLSEKNRLAKDTLKSVLFLWIVDLFYMSIFNQWLKSTYFFGIIAVVFLFYNVTHAFLKGFKTLQFLLPFEFLLGVGATVYLIYIIPDESLQEIILSVVTSVLGGLLALVGVAWTIRSTNEVRIADLQRLDIERMEEERKKHIPYVRISYTKEPPLIIADAEITTVLDLGKSEDRTLLDGNTYHSVCIENFNIKNVSGCNIILLGVVVLGKYYGFSHSEIMEPGVCCQIQTTGNYSVATTTLDLAIWLVVSDILGNRYEIKCPFARKYLSNSEPIFTVIDDDTYIGLYYDYTIRYIGLPELIKENEDEQHSV